ncbi:MAG: HNH endonuclease signature motif containing protein [Acidimicrobiaceae bacterium]|nr:HNH endonuclease signature motif containing protein [Acidimicrobiaceae bacterium]
MIRAHHIEWFSRGGTTDITNLALLCERCHHLVHDDGWQLHSDGSQLKLKPPSQPLTQPRSRSDARLRAGNNGEPPDVRARPQRNPILTT